MNRNVAQTVFLTAILTAALTMVGCTSAPNVRTSTRPSESKRQYLGLKKVAILPLYNIGGNKGAEEQLMDILYSELAINPAFEEVEDPRFVGNVMKALKIRKLDTLDVETVNKLGSEMRAQAILVGNINAWGWGEGAEASMNVSLTLTLLDTGTANPLWIGAGSHRGSFTWGRVFGLNEGPTDLEIGRTVVRSMLKDMYKEIETKREAELKRIKADEEAQLKSAAEAERRRLEEQMQQLEEQ
jgi:hypothetical protein